MTEIPKPANNILTLIDKALESKENLPRPHLGASIVGGPCERAIWYSFRWATIEKFSGRMLRLFARGANEEYSVVRLLKDAGMEIEFTGKNQKRVDFGCHVSGSLDGIITSGVPEAPNKKHVLEIKTHNKKSFDDLEKKGVKEAKPAHYTQMQMYMLGTNIDRALYFAVCKDDDRIYTERVRLDKEYAKDEVDRARHIAVAQHPPFKLSDNPSWFQCKFCPSKEICHFGEGTKNINCRTCHYSVPKEDGTWFCKNYESIIPVEYQYKGCEQYAVHDDLVAGKDVPF